MFPRTRLRRLRQNRAFRDLVAETDVSPRDLIYPVFVSEGHRQELCSLPGQYRESLASLPAVASRALDAGVPAILLFGITRTRDEFASGAYDADGIVQRAVRAVKEEHEDLLVFTDVCMCQYQASGHCGVLCEGRILNDASLPILSRIAVSHACAGADAVAPSDMMDGRVGAIREALDGAGHAMTPIISYAAKYASSFYGPFRDICSSAPVTGDRSTYQMDARNAVEALREVKLDIAEGADIVMVKPALSYLDIICRVKAMVDVPVMAYNVSGEYALIKAGAAAGVLDEDAAVREVLTSIRRAGADLIATYFALTYAEGL